MYVYKRSIQFIHHVQKRLDTIRGQWCSVSNNQRLPADFTVILKQDKTQE